MFMFFYTFVNWLYLDLILRNVSLYLFDRVDSLYRVGDVSVKPKDIGHAHKSINSLCWFVKQKGLFYDD